MPLDCPSMYPPSADSSGQIAPLYAGLLVSIILPFSLPFFLSLAQGYLVTSSKLALSAQVVRPSESVIINLSPQPTGCQDFQSGIQRVGEFALASGNFGSVTHWSLGQVIPLRFVNPRRVGQWRHGRVRAIQGVCNLFVPTLKPSPGHTILSPDLCASDMPLICCKNSSPRSLSEPWWAWGQKSCQLLSSLGKQLEGWVGRG